MSVNEGRIMLGRIEQIVAPEQPTEPPELAVTGAVRWIKRKVVVDGPTFVSAVSTEDVRNFACVWPNEGRDYLRSLVS